ncbi:MAG: hypothetical protein ACLGJB_07815 [Blastocatellia bacterium]
MSKSFALGFIVGVALLIVSGAGAFRSQRDDVKQIDAQAEEKEYQSKLLDATPVQVGVLSHRERIHSKLYSDYRSRRGGNTISGLVAQGRDKSRIVRTIAFVGMEEVLTEPETPERYFGQLAQASDAVIRGRVTKKASQISEDDAFVFTDYDVAVSEVLKNNAAAPIDTDATISVTRPGGRVLLDGIIVEAEDRAFEPLPMNNHEIILFLRYIRETGAYKATRATGSFELEGLNLRPLSKASLPTGVLRGKESFLQTLRTISNR